MSDELKIEDLLEGDGKAVVKGALITTQYNGWLEAAPCSTPPTRKAAPSSA